MTLNGFAQDFNVPQNYKLEKAEDYAPFEEAVLSGIEWLINTPLNEQTDKRKEVNAFLITWLIGSPYVHLEIKSEIVTFVNSETPDFLLIFMSGWAKYSITTKDYDNKVAGSLAGIEAVINFYNQNKKSLPKDKSIEKYIKLQKDGKLKEFIEKNA
jgi:hypothetical protein